MIEAVREFLLLFESESLSKDERLQRLARALDHLAYAYHKAASHNDPAGYEVIDGPDYNEVRELVIKYFPDFGFYPVKNPLADIDAAIDVGDAIDDLADIWKEMAEVKRQWDVGLTSAAEDQFKLGYEFHWGRHHLHPLRNYVSALIFQ